VATKPGNPTTVKELLTRAMVALESRRDAERIVALALQRPRAWLIAHTDAPIEGAELERFNSLVERRAEGVPFAYLAGSREFYGRDFRVDPAVLIPRPETEHLVEWALKLDLPEDACVTDIGTGSGCIILTLAAERPQWCCYGTDISAAALRVAATNRTLLDLANVELLHGDLLSPLAGQAPNLIVSNPPYVAEGDPHLTQGDVACEPEIALTAGRGGLEIIVRVVKESRKLLASGGWLLLEHGHDQAHAVRELLRQYGYREIESRPDLAGIERVTGGTSPAF